MVCDLRVSVWTFLGQGYPSPEISWLSLCPLCSLQRDYLGFDTQSKNGYKFSLITHPVIHPYHPFSFIRPYLLSNQIHLFICLTFLKKIIFYVLPVCISVCMCVPGIRSFGTGATEDYEPPVFLTAELSLQLLQSVYDQFCLQLLVFLHSSGVSSSRAGTYLFISTFQMCRMSPITQSVPSIYVV